MGSNALICGGITAGQFLRIVGYEGVILGWRMLPELRDVPHSVHLHIPLLLLQKHHDSGRGAEGVFSRPCCIYIEINAFWHARPPLEAGVTRTAPPVGSKLGDTSSYCVRPPRTHCTVCCLISLGAPAGPSAWGSSVCCGQPPRSRCSA